MERVACSATLVLRRLSPFVAGVNGSIGSGEVRGVATALSATSASAISRPAALTAASAIARPGPRFAEMLVACTLCRLGLADRGVHVAGRPRNRSYRVQTDGTGLADRHECRTATAKCSCSRCCSASDRAPCPHRPPREQRGRYRARRGSLRPPHATKPDGVLPGRGIGLP